MSFCFTITLLFFCWFATESFFPLPIEIGFVTETGLLGKGDLVFPIMSRFLFLVFLIICFLNFSFLAILLFLDFISTFCLFKGIVLDFLGIFLLLKWY